MNHTQAWLKAARVTRGQVNDLITDMRSDPAIPEFRTLKEMRAYLRDAGACRAALVAAAGAWRRYQRFCARQPAEDTQPNTPLCSDIQ